jgi:hypothetical protein
LRPLDLPEHSTARPVVEVEQEAGEAEPDAERADWLAHFGHALSMAWDTPEDDVYNCQRSVKLYHLWSN